MLWCKTLRCQPREDMQEPLVHVQSPRRDHTHTHTLTGTNLRAHPACPCERSVVCRTKWALSMKWFNRCVLTDLRPVGSLFSVYRGVLICRVRCQRGARSRAHHCAFICRPVLPIKTSQAGTSGASTALLVHVFMAAALPTYCLINEGAASSRRTVLYVLQGGEESTHSNTLTALSTLCTAVWWHLRKLYYNTTCLFLYVSVHSLSDGQLRTTAALSTAPHFKIFSLMTFPVRSIDFWNGWFDLTIKNK